MSEPSEPGSGSGRHGPTSVLTQAPFLFFSASRLASGIAQTMHQATLAWQVYELTGSAFALATVGGVRFVAGFAGGMIGGAVADTSDRGKTVMVAQLVPIFATLLLIGLTVAHLASMPVIYLLVALLGVANSFENPARQALLPQLVRRDTFQAAVITSSTIGQLAFALGPMTGGLAITAAGVQGAYGLTVLLTTLSAVLMLPIKPLYPMTFRGARLSLGLIKEGLHYVWKHQPVIGAMGLDTVAVMFAGAQALLPIYARDVLQVGSEGYGVLSSSQGLGALGMSVLLLFMPPIRRVGRAMVLTVAMFGLATLVFALSRNFYLSLLAYAMTGAFDQISVVMRNIIIQMGTPDALRGRVNAVNFVFIGAANQLGALHVGTVAQLTSATFALVYGSIGCLAGITVLGLKLPELWSHDSRHDAALRAQEALDADTADAAALRALTVR